MTAASGMLAAWFLLGPGQPAASAQEAVRPEWHARDIDGRAWSSASLRGEVVLLDFWATWCAPCLAEMPTLARLHDRYAARGLRIVGVSLDRSATRDFRSWLQRHGVVWPQIREPGGYDGPLATRFGVESLPASFLIGRDGALVAVDLRGAALEKQVTRLMEAR